MNDIITKDLKPTIGIDYSTIRGFTIADIDRYKLIPQISKNCDYKQGDAGKITTDNGFRIIELKIIDGYFGELLCYTNGYGNVIELKMSISDTCNVIGLNANQYRSRIIEVFDYIKHKYGVSINYPYFTRTTKNNGILGYVKFFDEEHKNKGNCICVGMMRMVFFYMKKDFYAGQFTKSIIPKFSEFDEDIALYFITWFNKNRYFDKCIGAVNKFKNVFDNTTIMVPIRKDKSIDYETIKTLINAYKKIAINKMDSEMTLKETISEKLLDT